ncbi:MAG TPA: glycoside hydrolase family 2 TIM barrel-domain containing protein [Chitinophagaceae bacterium]|nr:glycoside hydrolase family 2 TIM barrel-domain containing protein [Chitinophagaceae bacterium]
MKNSLALIFLLTVTSSCFSQRNILFDEGWRFHRGDVLNGEAVNFNDDSWRKIDLPHDWSIEDLPGTNSPFNPDAINGVSVGFTTGGTGWYRKDFFVSASEKNKKMYILFDGVYMNADVWINGIHLGNHPYGYTSFYYDISDKINLNGNNVIAVQVKNEGATSRWYSGSGIDRHVWFEIVSPVHIAQWGTYITTTNVSNTSANVRVETNVKNETAENKKVKLVTIFFDNRGEKVAAASSSETISANSEFTFGDSATITSPALWSLNFPARYKAISRVYVNGKLSDSVSTSFGIRKISFDAAHGFLLNGNPVKLKGGCFHIDNGPLGARAIDAAEIRRVALMKASGFNAIRCSHNPPAPAFLDACDSLGMLVIDEAFDCWNNGKNDNDYHLYFNDWWQRDLQSMLLRDRNHPSVIMWSIGNEIPLMSNKRVDDTAKILAGYVRSIDPTRPVTAAVNSVSEKMDNFFSALDVCGYNYAYDHYIPDHVRKPNRVMFATESFALTQFDYWMSVLDHPWVIGDFVWTGFDYIGESSIGWRGYPQDKNFYPWNIAYCGDIDICGWKRPQSYYRDALWKKNQLSVFVKPPRPSFPLNPERASWSIWQWDDVVPDWNWQGYEDSVMEINVYSSCDEAELFLNGKSLGKKQTNRATRFMAVYNVPYQPGELKAIGYTNGRKINESILKTAAPPVQIKLFADRKIIRADGQDLCYITAELVNKNGTRNPKAENLVHFSIEGNATIAGVGNANPMSTESYQQPQRKAWRGRCLVVVESSKKPGKIIIKAGSEGLPDSYITIQSK